MVDLGIYLGGEGTKHINCIKYSIKKLERDGPLNHLTNSPRAPNHDCVLCIENCFLSQHILTIIPYIVIIL